MKFGRFRLGMRTIKTALAVMTCIILYQLLDRGSPLIAAIGAVVSLRQDVNTSVSFGRSRIIGNSIGGALALIYFFIQAFFENDFYVNVIVIPILVILVIVISDGVGNQLGIVSSVAAVLLICLSIPQGESVAYTLNRILDTFIGTLIAVSINGIVVPSNHVKEEEIEEDLAELKKKELELTDNLAQVRKQIAGRGTPACAAKHQNEEEF